jgi:hypothetical protein
MKKHPLLTQDIIDKAANAKYTHEARGTGSYWSFAEVIVNETIEACAKEFELATMDLDWDYRAKEVAEQIRSLKTTP